MYMYIAIKDDFLENVITERLFIYLVVVKKEIRKLFFKIMMTFYRKLC